MRKTLILPILAAMLLLLPFSCKDGDDPEPDKPATGKISLASNNVKGLEVVTINVSDFELTEDVYEVELGTLKLKAAKNEENNSLIFLVPGELATGKYALKCGFAKNTLELSILAPAPIQDPEAYIAALHKGANDRFKEISKIYDERVIKGMLTAEEASNLKAIAKQASEEILTHTVGLAPEAKILYIQLIEANNHWLEVYNTEVDKYPFTNLRRRTGDDPCAGLKAQRKQLGTWQEHEINRMDLAITQCESEVATARMNAASGYLNQLKYAYVAAKADANSRSNLFYATRAFIKTFISKSFTGLLEEFKRVNNFSTDPFGLKSLDEAFSQRRTDKSYNLGQEYEIGAKVTLINLSKEKDKHLSSFATLSQGIDSYNSALTTLSEIIPNVPQIKLPAHKEQTLITSGFTIDNISDSRVSVELKNGGKGKVAKFTASGVSGEKVPFTYRMRVETKYGSAEKIISANLILPSPQSISMVTGNNQSAEPGTQLSAPLQVKVTDATNKVLENVEVEWSVKTGNGLLNASKTKTNAQGIAQVNWTLGGATAAKEQKVEAIAKKLDGSMVAGAPVSFIAKEAIDSTEIYKAAVLGNWNVLTYSNGSVSSSTNIVLLPNGRGTIPMSLNPTYVKEYQISWHISKSNDGYRLHTTGFWHYAFDGLSRDKLTYPASSFRTYSSVNPGQTSQIFSKQ